MGMGMLLLGPRHRQSGCLSSDMRAIPEEAKELGVRGCVVREMDSADLSMY